MKQMRLNQWTLALAACGVVSVGAVANADAQTTNAPMTESGTAIGSKANQGFWKRLDAAFLEQLGTPSNPVTTNAPPARRDNPVPFDSPPFFNGEWQIGGTEAIGDQNLTPDYPLMEAIYEGPHGQAWESTKIKFYGWVDTSGNLSTSQKSGEGANGQSANYPVIYSQRPDRFEMDQTVLYIERTPDENQTDHIDWGFRIANVYGLDYRYMISKGLWSDQLDKRNHYYGYDMPMFYFNLYVPNVFDGMNITVGRIISEADIEAQLAPNNPMSTHSLLYSYDPYTQEGIFGTIKLNKNWTVQAGLANGNDVAIWEPDPGNQPTGTFMFQYQSSDNKFSFYGGGNCVNNAEYGYNNIQQYVGTLSYKFNEKVWTTQETWYMYQQGFNPNNKADVNLPVNASSPEIRPAGMNNQAGAGVLLPGYSYEYATLNYTMFRLAPNAFFTTRCEMFDDAKGQRTGYDTVYQEDAIGITWWPDELITFRPELRYDHSFRELAYDNGTRHNQVMASFDIIVHF